MDSRSQTEVDRLVTRLHKDASYADHQDVPSGSHKGLPVYVCPRADDHGRRDGLIPPGVAAVRGLIPRTGLKHVSNQSVGREAASDGLTEAERYRRYYGKSLQHHPTTPVQRVPQPSQPPQIPHPVPEDYGQGNGNGETPVTRPVATPVDKPVARAAKRAAVRPQSKAVAPKNRVNPAKSRAVPVLREVDGGTDDETLDGFYDSLGGPAPGTLEGSAEEREALASARGERLPPPLPPRVQEEPGVDEVVGIRRDIGVQEDPRVAEVAELRRALAVANSAIGEQQELITRLQAEVDTLRKRPGPVVHETVRVQLAAEQEKIKLGGHGWECRVLGHLDFGRDGRSAVLTVSDPGYASELMAEIQVGELVILHGSERTACEYAGECSKLYGDPSSPDFIAVFRFSLTGSGE